MKRYQYKSDLPRKMYSYFTSFEGGGAPSFSGFAKSIGVTLKTLESFRKKAKFDEAYLECSEIRRDYLINSALCKRCDSTFAKFILCSEYKMDAEKSDGADSFNISVKVIE